MSTLFNFLGPKKVPEGTKQWQLKQYAQQTLGSGNLRTAVQLPEGEDLQEWIAVHVVDFFNHVNMLYGTVSEFCTPTECPIMNAGPKYEYYWEDGEHYKKPTHLSAPAYVEALMTWTQSILDDEKHFPQKMGVKFPPTFTTTAKTILRRLFRVYAHIYHSHFDQICALGIEAHLNTNYRHFLLFVDEFSLLSEKDLVPLEDFNKTILDETPRKAGRHTRLGLHGLHGRDGGVGVLQVVQLQLVDRDARRVRAHLCALFHARLPESDRYRDPAARKAQLGLDQDGLLGRQVLRSARGAPVLLCARAVPPVPLRPARRRALDQDAARGDPERVVGRQAARVRPARLSRLPHPQRVLHGLRVVRRAGRRVRLHPHRPRPARRLCAHVVRDVPRQLGAHRLEDVAGRARRLDRRHVRRQHRPLRPPPRLLWRVRLRPEHVLRRDQPRARRRGHRARHLAPRPGGQPALRAHAVVHGRRLLHLPHRLGRRKPHRRRPLQPAPPLGRDKDDDRHPRRALHLSRHRLLDLARRHVVKGPRRQGPPRRRRRHQPARGRRCRRCRRRRGRRPPRHGPAKGPPRRDALPGHPRRRQRRRAPGQRPRRARRRRRRNRGRHRRGARRRARRDKVQLLVVPHHLCARRNVRRRPAHRLGRHLDLARRAPDRAAPHHARRRLGRPRRRRRPHPPRRRRRARRLHRPLRGHHVDARRQLVGLLCAVRVEPRRAARHARPLWRCVSREREALAVDRP